MCCSGENTQKGFFECSLPMIQMLVSCESGEDDMTLWAVVNKTYDLGLHASYMT